MPTTVSAAAPSSPREVVVPQKDYLLFRQVGITPPEQEGQKFDIHELDKKLAPFDLNTCMRVKAALVRCRLLDAGRPIYHDAWS